jgi:hypothetical protein
MRAPVKNSTMVVVKPSARLPVMIEAPSQIPEKRDSSTICVVKANTIMTIKGARAAPLP